MKHLPLFADLHNKPCLIVGGGLIASRRAVMLLRCGAQITVLSPRIRPEIASLAAAGKLTIREGTFAFAQLDLTDYWLIIAATNDHAVNTAVAEAADGAGRFCNVVDDPALCSFIMPAIIDREPVTIAISSAGTSPVLARWIKGTIESLVPTRIGQFAKFLHAKRADVRSALPDDTRRRHFWQAAVASTTAELSYAGKTVEADAVFKSMLADWAEATDDAAGVAWIVGAGPGAPDLMTLRARQLLATADVVMYDRLVNPEILEFARRDAEFISVGKTPGKRCNLQHDINTRLVDLVRAGNRVCRLKGGDPMIFGRVAEELNALVDAGLRFEIVPGISAFAGCAAYAGIPLTWRGVSQSVLITTGHTISGEYVALPASGGTDESTLAIYMAAARSAIMAQHLLESGLLADTPIAIIENGTLENQKVRRLLLGELAAPNAIEVSSPALLLVGKAVHESAKFAWFGQTIV